MGVRPVGRQQPWSLVCGDYLRLSELRAAVYGHGIDEGCARIERLEHLPAERAEVLLVDQPTPRGEPTPVVWCHGLPGPVILEAREVGVLDVASPRRVEHDRQNPWWPSTGEVLLRGGYPAGDQPHGCRRRHDRSAEAFIWPEPDERDRVPRRPTTFAKPASAVLVGDYLGVHPGRWPHTDREIDEGFDRVDHVRLLGPEESAKVFADPAWHTATVVVSVRALPGVLLLRGGDEVTVLAGVNLERSAWDVRNPWSSNPALVLQGSHEPTEDEARAAAEIDVARRPRVDECELYPSWYPDDFSRRMALQGVHGFRSVPLAALPWSHFQAACPLRALAEDYQDRVPDMHAAHAAASLSRASKKIRAKCEYHQADWPRLVRILDEAMIASEGSARRRVKAHPEFEQLSSDEQEWLESLALDPIIYDDRDDSLTNGQHRLCAMRFAGVTHCLVEGTYLPDTDYGVATSVRADARAEIAASWKRLAVERDWPTWLAAVARFLPAAWRTRLMNRRTILR